VLKILNSAAKFKKYQIKQKKIKKNKNKQKKIKTKKGLMLYDNYKWLCRCSHKKLKIEKEI
tara:strand:+ start:666 stop:848 length:183 start_codon:yes stop_codon:yes gene_type:complete